MAWGFISKDYPSPMCYAVPLLIQALRLQRNWKHWQVAKAAGIALREAALIETPGHRMNMDTLERVATAFLLSLPAFMMLAASVSLPADRSLTVFPPAIPLVLPPLPKWARP
jgi:hypothetical protein